MSWLVVIYRREMYSVSNNAMQFFKLWNFAVFLLWILLLFIWSNPDDDGDLII